MGVTFQQENGVLVAALSGELDHHAAGPIRMEIDRLCSETMVHTLILDFGGITFMDSSGIGLVMGRYRLMQELGGEVVLSNLPSQIKRVMRMAGLDRLAVMGAGAKAAKRAAAASPPPPIPAASADVLPDPPADPDTMEEDSNDESDQ